MSKILYTGGSFDILHYGHINFLKKCYKICKNVTVSLNTDDFISTYKSSPVMSYQERELSLLECKFVKSVIPNTFGSDSKPTILSINPDIIAVGDDWCHKNYYDQMGFTQEWLDDHDITLIYIPYTKGISTSEIKRRINDQ